MTAPVAKTSRPEHSGPATVTGTGLARSTDSSSRTRCSWPDQRRPQDVMDAAIEDHDRRAVDRLACPPRGRCRRRPARPGTARAPAAARAPASSGSSAQPSTMPARPRPSPTRSSDSSCGSYGIPRPPPASTSRTVVAAQPREPAGGPHRRRACGDERAASRTFDAPKACSPSSSRCWRSARPAGPRQRRSAASIPNLPAPSSPTSGPARAGPLGHGRPRAGPVGAGLLPPRSRSSRAELAGRLDRHRADPGADSGPRARRRACRARSSRSGRRAIPARSAVASSPPEATSAPSPRRAEVRDDRQRRVRLDRVGEVDPLRQDGPERRDLAVDDVEVVDVERRPEPLGELVAASSPAEPARPQDLVAGRRPAATRPAGSDRGSMLIGGPPRARPGRSSRHRGP